MQTARWTISFTITGGVVVALLCPVVTRIPEVSGAVVAADSGSSLVSELLEKIVREQLEEEYIDDDDWGKTRRVTVGYKIKGKPFEWDLQRRTKVVNDGLWEKYKVRLVDPDEHLQVTISQLEIKDGRVFFGLTMVAKLEGDARVERWRQGIKMLNAHVEAVGTLSISLNGQIGISVETSDTWPAIVIAPVIDKVDIKLLKFDLKRISKIEGKAAHEFGDGLKDTIQRELNRREAKIAAKLNRSIAKRHDKLRISPQDFAKSGWAKLQESLK